MTLKQLGTTMTKPLLLHFDAGLRQQAQAAADADYRGNLTAYLNALIKADAQRRAKASRRSLSPAS